jgi:hypothetical protein
MRMQYRHISATRDAFSDTSRLEFIQQNTYYCSTLYKSLHIHRLNLVEGRVITNYIYTNICLCSIHPFCGHRKSKRDSRISRPTIYFSVMWFIENNPNNIQHQLPKRNVKFASYDAYSSTVAMSNF